MTGSDRKKVLSIHTPQECIQSQNNYNNTEKSQTVSQS